jgi:hypothetical protein
METIVSAPITPETRARVLKGLARSEQVLEQSLGGFVALRRRAARKGIPVVEATQNAFEFTTLTQFELSCLLRDMIQSDYSRLRATLYAGLVLLAVYETSKKYRQILSSDFQGELGRVLGPDGTVEARSIHRSASDLYKKCDRDFGDVRRGLLAHRDPCAHERLRLLRKIDVRRIADLAIGLLTVGRQLTELELRYIRALLR